MATFELGKGKYIDFGGYYSSRNGITGRLVLKNKSNQTQTITNTGTFYERGVNVRIPDSYITAANLPATATFYATEDGVERKIREVPLVLDTSNVPVQGPIGETGPQGPQGPAGQKGDTGNAGAQGARGESYSPAYVSVARANLSMTTAAYNFPRRIQPPGSRQSLVVRNTSTVDIHLGYGTGDISNYNNPGAGNFTIVVPPGKEYFEHYGETRALFVRPKDSSSTGTFMTEIRKI